MIARLSRRYAIASFLLLGAAHAGAAPVDAPTRAQVIATLAKELDATYVFPDLGKQIGQAMLKQHRSGKYDALNDAKAFAAAVTADVRAASRDLHLTVRFHPQPVPEQSEDGPPTAAQQAEREARLKASNYGIGKAERLPGNIGLIELNGFVDDGDLAVPLAAAMTSLATTDALIFDLRKNGGGSPESVALLCTYLFDQRTHLNDLYYRAGNRTEQYWTLDRVQGTHYGQRKPVYVVTSSKTFSAAEEFSYNLKNLKRAVLVGETTRGGANPGDVRKLDAHFSAFIPNGRAINPITKTNWEGVGVAPDVAAPAPAALATAQRLALTALAATEQDGGKRQALAAALANLPAP